MARLIPLEVSSSVTDESTADKVNFDKDIQPLHDANTTPLSADKNGVERTNRP